MYGPTTSFAVDIRVRPVAWAMAAARRDKFNTPHPTREEPTYEPLEAFELVNPTCPSSNHSSPRKDS